MFLSAFIAVSMEHHLGSIYEDISEENAVLNTVAEEPAEHLHRPYDIIGVLEKCAEYAQCDCALYHETSAKQENQH